MSKWSSYLRTYERCLIVLQFGDSCHSDFFEAKKNKKKKVVLVPLSFRSMRQCTGCSDPAACSPTRQVKGGRSVAIPGSGRVHVRPERNLPPRARDASVEARQMQPRVHTCFGFGGWGKRQPALQLHSRCLFASGV